MKQSTKNSHTDRIGHDTTVNGLEVSLEFDRITECSYDNFLMQTFVDDDRATNITVWFYANPERGNVPLADLPELKEAVDEAIDTFLRENDPEPPEDRGDDGPYDTLDERFEAEGW